MTMITPSKEKMSSEINPVGRLQELAVKEGWAMPVYDYDELSQTEFRCFVTLNGLIGEAVASRKQYAKNMAASSLLLQIKAPELVSRLAPLSRQPASSPKVSSLRQPSVTPISQQKPFNALADLQAFRQSASSLKVSSLRQPSVTPISQQKPFNALADLQAFRQPASPPEVSSPRQPSVTSISQQKPTNALADLQAFRQSASSLKVSSLRQPSVTPISQQKPINALADLQAFRQPSVTSPQKPFNALADVQPFIKVLDECCQPKCNKSIETSPVVANIENGSVSLSRLSTTHNLCEVSDSDESLSKSMFDRKSQSLFQSFSSSVDFNAVYFLNNELSKQNKKALYELVHTDNSGTNNPVFFYKVSALGKVGQGKGSSKKEAKGNAASSLLEILYEDCTDGEIKAEITVKDNHVGRLMDFCISNFIKTAPVYELVNDEGAAHSKVFTMSCTVGHYQAQSSAKTKQAAKNMAAKALLEKLESEHKRSPIEGITFVSALEREDINEKAWKRLVESNVRTQLNLNQTPNSIPLQDYLYLFENDYYGKSETLEIFKKKNTISDIKIIPNPQGICQKILEELSIKYSLETLQSACGYTVNLLTITQPRWSFIESAPTEAMALHKLYTAILEFLCLM